MKSFEERSPRWQRNANRLDAVANIVPALSAVTLVLLGLLAVGFVAGVSVGVWRLLTG